MMPWVDQICDEIKHDRLDASDHAGLVMWMLRYITDRYPDDTEYQMDSKIRDMFNHLCKQNIPIDHNVWGSSDEFVEDTWKKPLKRNDQLTHVLRAIRLVMHNCHCSPSDTRNQ